MTLIDKSGWYLIGVQHNESIQTAVDNMTGSGYKATVTKASLVKNHITTGSNRNSPHPFEPEDWEVVSDFDSLLSDVYSIISSGSLGIWVYVSVADSYTVTFVYTDDDGNSNILGDLVVKYDINGVGYNSVRAPPVFSGYNAKISVDTVAGEYIEYTTTSFPIDVTITEYNGTTVISSGLGSVVANYDNTLFTLQNDSGEIVEPGGSFTAGSTLTISLIAS